MSRLMAGALSSGGDESGSPSSSSSKAEASRLEDVFRVAMVCLSCVACCAEERQYLLQKDTRLRLVDVVMSMTKGRHDYLRNVMIQAQNAGGPMHPPTDASRSVSSPSSAPSSSGRRLGAPSAFVLRLLSSVAEGPPEHEGAQASKLLRERLRAVSGSPDALIDEFHLCESVLVSYDKPLMMYEEDRAQVALPVEKKTEFGIMLRRSIAEFELLPFEEVCSLMAHVRDALDGCSINDDETEALRWAGAGGQRAASTGDGPDHPLFVCDEGDDNREMGMDVDMDEDMELSDEDEDAQTHPSEQLPDARNESSDNAKMSLDSRPPGAALSNDGLVEQHVTSGAAHARSGDADERRLPESDFEKFLHSVVGLDHPAAIASLHRHFDTLDTACDGDGTGGTNAETSAFALGVGKEPTVSRPADHGGSKSFQDALLCLTSARARLGHTVEALQALNETVRVAQQNGDAICLVHCLASLCSLQMSAITQSSRQSRASWAGPVHRARLVLLLRRCLSRSMELRLLHITCFARLSLAYLDLQYPVPVDRIRIHGAGVSHFSAFNGEMISKSQAVHALSNTVTLCSIDMHQAAMAAAVLPRSGGVADTAPSAGATPGAQPQANAGGLAQRGDQQPSELYGQTFALCENFARVPDTVAATAAAAHVARAASWSLFGGGGMARSDMLSVLGSLRRNVTAESMDFANGWLATNAADRLSHECAEAFLRNVANGRTGVHCRTSSLIFAFRTAIARGDSESAFAAAEGLRALAATLTQNREEAGIEADRYLSLAHMCFGDARAAERIANLACGRAYRAGLLIPTMQMLLMLSEIHRSAGNHVMALPHALSAFHQAQGRGLDMIAARAEFCVMEALAEMHPGHCKPAQRTVEKLLPLFMAHADLELRGRALLLLVRCRLTCTGHAEVRSRPGTVLSPLKTAIEVLRDAHLHEQLVEAYYLLAMTCHAIGREKDRDAAAANAIKWSGSPVACAH